MRRRAALTEAKRSGRAAVIVGKHSSYAARTAHTAPSLLVRMPPQYTTRDVALLLEALWSMFTQSQAQRLMVAVPWDDTDEPRRMVLADLAALLERWLDGGEEVRALG
jgi:hypothetical protein